MEKLVSGNFNDGTIFVFGSGMIGAIGVSVFVSEFIKENKLNLGVEILSDAGLINKVFSKTELVIKGIILMSEMRQYDYNRVGMFLSTFDTTTNIANDVEKECEKRNISLLELKENTQHDNYIDQQKNILDWLQQFLS
jgi:hypothetical protein